MKLKEIQEIKELAGLDFIARQVVEGFITGLHKSPYHGFSVEFAEHRLYNTGESTRFIDWKLYARTEKLFVKRFEEETNLRHYIVLDTSSSMLFPLQGNDPVKLRFAVYVSAALFYLFNKQRDANGLITFSDKIDFMSDAKLNTVHNNMLLGKLQDILDNYETLKDRETSLAGVLHEVAEKIHKRSLIVVLSDLITNEPLDEIVDALLHLKYNKHEVIVFHLYDKKFEVNFEFENRPYKFVDLESGEIVKLNPNRIREVYKERLGNINRQVKEKVEQLGIDFVQADINQDFREVLLPYLLKRQKLY